MPAEHLILAACWVETDDPQAAADQLAEAAEAQAIPGVSSVRLLGTEAADRLASHRLGDFVGEDSMVACFRRTSRPMNLVPEIRARTLRQETMHAMAARKEARKLKLTVPMCGVLFDLVEGGGEATIYATDSGHALVRRGLVESKWPMGIVKATPQGLALGRLLVGADEAKDGGDDA